LLNLKPAQGRPIIEGGHPNLVPGTSGIRCPPWQMIEVCPADTVAAPAELWNRKSWATASGWTGN